MFSVGFSVDSKAIMWGTTDQCPQMTSCPTILGALEWKLRLPFDGAILGRPEQFPVTEGAVRARLSSATHSLALRAGGTQNKPDAILDITAAGKSVGSIERDQWSGYRHSAYTLTADGQRVVSGGSAGILLAYDLSGRTIARLFGHDGDIAAVAASMDGRFILSGSGDQTVRLWNATTWELVVTLYHGADGEWVLWTPQGFYTGSPGGGALVGWQLNNGPDVAAEYVTGEQFRKVLNRPDIVEKAIVLGSAAAAIREVYPEGFNLANLLRSRPAKVEIVSPPPNSTVSGGYVPLMVRVASDRPTEGIEVYVGGRKVSATMIALPPDVAHFQGEWENQLYRVPLNQGENQISVVATNAAGSSPVAGNVRRVFHRGEGALDRRGTLYIIAIGVDLYLGLPHVCGRLHTLPCNLTYSGADAKLFVDMATRDLGPSHEHIVYRLLINGAGVGNEPTKKNILRAMDALRMTDERDTVVVMVAAHGEETTDGRYFILPTDTQRRLADKAKAGSGINKINWKDIEGPVNRALGRRLIFVDACHAGRAQTVRAYNDKLLADARAERFVVFSATGPDQEAGEDQQVGHGLFTYVLADGIDGKALDLDEQTVRVYHLGDYLSKEVRRRSEGSQEPEFYSGIGNFALVKK